MTKYELNEKLREKSTTRSAKEAEMIVNTILDFMTESLASGGRSSFRGGLRLQLKR